MSTRCPSCGLNVGPDLALSGVCPVCTDRSILRRHAPELAARLDAFDAEDATPATHQPKAVRSPDKP